MDTYCNFCGGDNRPLVATHDKKSICFTCADKYGMCEICGSLLKEGQLPDNQPHYLEECFK